MRDYGASFSGQLTNSLVIEPSTGRWNGFKVWFESAMQTSGDLYLNIEAVNQDSPPRVKIALFRSLFRGRPDVYPVRFESRTTGKPAKSIGRLGGGKKRLTGVLDVALMQSLVRKSVVDDRIQAYGHVVVDECHHLSAASFEMVVRQSKARFLTGLSATVTRKDGHHPIIFMQCGPIRYRVDAKKQAAAPVCSPGNSSADWILFDYRVRARSARGISGALQCAKK